MQDGGVIEIQIPCGSAAEATAIADALVERRCAACVQALPVRSTYRWNGNVTRDDEVLLLVKTTAERFGDVASVVEELHSYELPAISAVEVCAGSDRYLDWVRAESGR